MTRISRIGAAFFVALTVDNALAQQPVGTAVTYQGQLKQNGQPFNGNASLEFRLFDAESDGNQIGSTVTIPSQPVTNGLFTSGLDFGATPFTTGQARWVQLSVDGTMLIPRQRLASAPHSLSTRGITVGASGNVGIGVINPADAFEIGGGNLVLNRTGANGILVFRNLLPGGHRYEWYPDNAEVGGISLYDRTANYTPLTVSPSGNVGIGTLYPDAQLAVAGSAIVTGNVTIGGALTTSPAARTLSINSAAFQPQDYTYEYDRLPGGQPAISGFTPGNTARFYASVQLPQGSTIIGLAMQCLDNSGSRDISMTLSVVPNDPAGTTVLASVSSIGQSSNWRSFSSTGFNAVTDNVTSSYMLFATWTVPNPYHAIRLGNVQVNYTVVTPAP